MIWEFSAISRVCVKMHVHLDEENSSMAYIAKRMGNCLFVCRH